MTNLVEVQKFLVRLQFLWTEQGLILHQQSYALEILTDFDMTLCNRSWTPLPKGLHLETNMNSPLMANPTLYQMFVGKAHFLTNTHLELAFVVNTLSRFLQAPQDAHKKACKHVLRYIRQAASMGLFYPHRPSPNSILELQGFSDADWSGDQKTRRSTSAYVFLLNHSPIRSFKLQDSVALSSTESEYRSLTECAKESTWLRNYILMEIQVLGPVAITLFVDNSSAIKLVKNPIFHDFINAPSTLKDIIIIPEKNTRKAPLMFYI